MADITSQTPTLSLQMFRFKPEGSVFLGFWAWRTPQSGEEFTCPCPWFLRWPEVEEQGAFRPGQQVAEERTRTTAVLTGL